MDFGIVSYGAIAVICYVVGVWLKGFDQFKDELIPPTVMTAGLVLGIVAYVIGVPDFPAHDLFNAAAVGAVSGGLAIASNQVYKQLGKLKDSTD